MSLQSNQAAELVSQSGDPPSEDLVAACFGKGGPNDGDGVAHLLAAGLRLSPGREESAASDQVMMPENQPEGTLESESSTDNATAGSPMEAVAQSLATGAIRDLRALSIRVQDGALLRQQEMAKDAENTSFQCNLLDLHLTILLQTILGSRHFCFVRHVFACHRILLMSLWAFSASIGFERLTFFASCAALVLWWLPWP